MIVIFLVKTIFPKSSCIFLLKIKKNDKNDKHNIIKMLTKIGIGSKKAKNLANIDVKTLEDFKKRQNELLAHQRLGLKYRPDLSAI